ncbi:hypothetical protein [Deinococcus xinjiangensis]
MTLLPLALLGIAQLVQVLTTQRQQSLDSINQVLSLYNGNYLERIGDMQDSTARTVNDEDIRAMAILRAQELMQSSPIPVSHVVVTDDKAQPVAATSNDETTKVASGEGYAMQQWAKAHPETMTAARAAASAILTQVAAGKPTPTPYTQTMRADGQSVEINAQVLPQGNGVSVMFADGSYLQRKVFFSVLQALWPLLLVLALTAAYANREGGLFAKRLIRFAGAMTDASNGKKVKIPVTGNDEVGDAEHAGNRVYTSYLMAEQALNKQLGFEEPDERATS